MALRLFPVFFYWSLQGFSLTMSKGWALLHCFGKTSHAAIRGCRDQLPRPSIIVKDNTKLIYKQNVNKKLIG